MFDIQDVDRTLEERGVEDACLMGKWLRKHKYFPDVIITSHAVRANGTGSIIAWMLGYPNDDILINKSLYEHGVAGYRDVLSSLDKDLKMVMLVGHNPDISSFGASLCNEFQMDFPTAAIAGIELKIKDWKQARDTQGKLKFFEYPPK